MAGNRVICETNNVDYMAIRKAMVTGLRTFDEIKEATNLCGDCDGCNNEVEGILTSVCGCNNISLETVVNAVKAGADTVDKAVEATGAGAACGRCKILVENIVAIGK